MPSACTECMSGYFLKSDAKQCLLSCDEDEGYFILNQLYKLDYDIITNDPLACSKCPIEDC